MYRLLESIRIFNGVVQHPDIHFKRMERALGKSKLPLNETAFLDLFTDSDTTKATVVKARLLYDENGFSINFEPYTKRKINSLVLRHGDHISYSVKYADRSQIKGLMHGLDPESDVLILQNGMVTDTSYCNVAFYNGSDWYTPTKPLLNGIQRQYLLQSKLVKKRNIKASDIQNYSKIRLFNAMMPWDEALELDIEQGCIEM